MWSAQLVPGFLPVLVDVKLGIVPQVNCKDLGELLDAKQPIGDSNTFLASSSPDV
jgi:hypothetical protein